MTIKTKDSNSWQQWRHETRSFRAQDLVIKYFSLIVVAVLAPFAVNDILTGRYNVAIADIAVMILVSLDFISVKNRGRILIPRSLLMSVIGLILWFLIYQQGILAIYWSYTYILCLYFVLRHHRALIINAVFLVGIVPLSIQAVGLDETYRVFATMALSGFVAYIFSLIVETQREYLEQQAITDVLTGVYNRRHLQTRMKDLVTERSRHGLQLTQIMFDIDNFKLTNDKFGHDYGDRVLINTVQTVRSRIRLTDQVFRLGGDEFVILLPGTGAEEAEKIAEDIRNLVAGSDANEHGSVTISCGVSEHGEDETLKSWVNRCDEALYRAKNSGRNQVRLAA